MTKPNNQALIDGVRTMGQLLLTNGTSSGEAFDSKGKPVSYRSKYAHKFSYFAALDVVASKLRAGMKRREFWVYIDEACDRTLGKTMFSDIWELATPSTRKHWATKLANYTGKQS